MRTKALGMLAGLALMLAPGVAQAAPGTVQLRVEGGARTLVPRAAVGTTAQPAGKGVPAQSCPGTSALGALDVATAGDWSGLWSDQYTSWEVRTIKGETHGPDSSSFWALWINYRFSDLGVCGAELQPGDDVVLAPECYAAGCGRSSLLRLDGVPAGTQPGTPVKVTVSEHTYSYNPDYSTTTSAHPAAGATVSYGGASATTGADGSALLSFGGSGPVSVRATKPGRVPSAVEQTCVSGPGACGSGVPGGGGGSVRGEARDREAPRATISGLRTGQRLRRSRAPRELRGSVSADRSGLKAVKLSLTRKVGKRCWYFSGRSETFRRGACAKPVWLGIGDRAAWSYLLPRRLAPGRYTIRASAIDNAFNRSSTEVVIRVR